MKKLIITITTLITLTNTAQAITNNSCIDKYDQYAKRIKSIVKSVRTESKSFMNCIDRKLTYTSGSCSAIRSIQKEAREFMNSLENKADRLDEYATRALKTGDRCMNSDHDVIAEDLWTLQEFADDEREKMYEGSMYSSMGEYYWRALECVDDLHYEAKKKNCN